MSIHILLASGSQTRADLLRNAGLRIETEKPKVDEETVKLSLLADSATPRDIADCLAEMKARKVSDRTPDKLVLGCDQVLDHGGELLSKPESPDHCVEQILSLSGTKHKLHSAAVIYQSGEPLWRFVGVVNMQMRRLSPKFVDAYVARNWDSIRHSVGGYKLEEEGAQLFSAVRGDFFHVLGLPLLGILGYLTDRGDLDIQ